MTPKPDEESYYNETIHTIKSSLGNVQFPAETEDLIREAGDVTLPASRDGTEVPLKAVLEALGHDDYESVDRLVETVDDNWPRLKDRFARG